MSKIQRIQRKNDIRYQARLTRGSRVLKTKVFPQRKLAVQWLRRMESDQNAVDALGMRGAKLRLSELADRYLADYTGRDTTRPGQIEFWRGQLGQYKLTTITTDMAREQLNRYAMGKAMRPYGGANGKRQVPRKTQRKPATVNRMRAALSALFQYAIHAGDLNLNPVRNVPQRPENNLRERYLSKQELDRLLAAAQESSWDRLYALIVLAVTTGARKSELLNLKWADIDWGRREATLRRSKNGDPRVLTLPPAAMDALRPHRGIGLVFASKLKAWQPMEIKKFWLHALESAKLHVSTTETARLRFHDLRHTTASYLVQHGATLFEVGEVLGHRSVQTTKRYAHLSTAHKHELTDRVMGEFFGTIQ